MEQYYILTGNLRYGPMAKENLSEYGLTPQSMVWRAGLSEWVPAGSLAELADVMPDDADGCPPPPPPYNGNRCYVYNSNPVESQKLTTALLAILLGGLGIQYFYLGKTTAGILCILFSIVSCGLWNVVTLVSGILILLMSDNEFEDKFLDPSRSFPIF